MDQQQHADVHMTSQQLFDQMVNHLRQQHAKSMMPGDLHACAYRGEHGRKCPAGILVLDEEYSPDMENKPFRELLQLYPSLRGRYAEHSYLISRMQDVHDNRYVNNWEGEFQHVARALNLLYTPPPTIQTDM